VIELVLFLKCEVETPTFAHLVAGRSVFRLRWQLTKALQATLMRLHQVHASQDRQVDDDIVLSKAGFCP
jgi:hypothetical protein